MPWTVEFADDARREFLALHEPERGLVENLYRVRAGGRYRVVYYVDQRQRKIVITRVRNRKDAYGGL